MLDIYDRSSGKKLSEINRYYPSVCILLITMSDAGGPDKPTTKGHQRAKTAGTKQIKNNNACPGGASGKSR